MEKSAKCIHWNLKNVFFVIQKGQGGLSMMLTPPEHSNKLTIHATWKIFIANQTNVYTKKFSEIEDEDLDMFENEHDLMNFTTSYKYGVWDLILQRYVYVFGS